MSSPDNREYVLPPTDSDRIDQRVQAACERYLIGKKRYSLDEKRLEQLKAALASIVRMSLEFHHGVTDEISFPHEFAVIEEMCNIGEAESRDGSTIWKMLHGLITPPHRNNRNVLPTVTSHMLNDVVQMTKLGVNTYPPRKTSGIYVAPSQGTGVKFAGSLSGFTYRKKNIYENP